MTPDGTGISERGAPQRLPSTVELVDRLSRFDGPPEQFLVSLLAVQCHIASADGGVILRPAGEGGKTEILAVFPALGEGSTAPVWLAQAVEWAPSVIASGETVLKPLQAPDDLYGQPARQCVAMIPLRGGGAVRGLAAYVFGVGDQEVLSAGRERLELTVSLLSLYEMRLTLQRRQFDLRRLRMAMETLSAVNEQSRFAGASMAACNEIAARWNCQRVSIGFPKGRYVQLAAMSHTEKFSRRMRLIQNIEAAMEECWDQNVEVVYPAHPQATYVSRMSGELSHRYGPGCLVSLPLRRGEEVVGVLTAERAAERPFDPDELEALRLTCDMCTPRLAELHEHDRWFGAKAAAATKKVIASLIGPKHTWAKAVAIVAFLFLLFAFLGRGDYQAEASFALEDTRLQVVPAPFEGFLKDVFVRFGQTVEKGQALASLDSSDLRLELARAKAEKIGYDKQALAADQAAFATQDASKRAEGDIARANADKVAEQIKLLEHRIAQANIVAPIAGNVVTGDLERQVGAPVKIGQVLFEVAPLESLRAQLKVPEDQIADVRVGQRGELATVGHPDQRIRFLVERINPVAEVVERQNIFKIRVELKDLDLRGKHAWLLPGMEGVAKIDIGRRSYAWLWTRRLANWLRMKLWL
jgi:multidrug resistance efflux pump